MRNALIAGLRAMADALEAKAGTNGGSLTRKGRLQEVLRGFEQINSTRRGVTPDEQRQIAIRAGYDPRGLAGLYSPNSKMLELKPDGGWITAKGKARS